MQVALDLGDAIVLNSYVVTFVIGALVQMKNAHITRRRQDGPVTFHWQRQAVTAISCVACTTDISLGMTRVCIAAAAVPTKPDDACARHLPLQAIALNS